MKQYLELCKRIIETGTWVENARTGKRCKTVINADFEYDCREGKLPLITTRKAFWKPAIAEMLGYLRGYNNAGQFRSIGCNTWNANANENEAWLSNPNRKGKDDMGRAYGPQIRDWDAPNGRRIDQLSDVYCDLKKGVDNRSEIITFTNPGERYKSCLNACMHTHQFSLLDGVLYLHSYQRSDDVPLGHVFNQIQVAWLLMIMAKITNNKPGIAYHKVVNAHIYEDQMDGMLTQLERHPYGSPSLLINDDIKTLRDLETWVTIDDFAVPEYDYHPAISYAFSV